MYITPPVTAEEYDGSHHPRYAEWSTILCEDTRMIMVSYKLKNKKILMQSKSVVSEIEHITAGYIEFSNRLQFTKFVCYRIVRKSLQLTYLTLVRLKNTMFKGHRVL